MTDAQTDGGFPAPQPSSMYRWVVLIIISLAMFSNYYIYDSIAPIADMLKSDLGFSGRKHRPAVLGLLHCGGDRAAAWRGDHRQIRHRQVDDLLRLDLHSGRDPQRHDRGSDVMLAARFLPRNRFRTAHCGDHNCAGEVVQGQGAQLRLRHQPDDRPARIGFCGLVAHVGEVCIRRLAMPADGRGGDRTLCVVAAITYGALEGIATTEIRPRQSGRDRQARAGRICSASAVRSGSWCSLCVTFYSAIFPFRVLRHQVLHRSRGTTRARRPASSTACCRSPQCSRRRSSACWWTRWANGRCSWPLGHSCSCRST